MYPSNSHFASNNNNNDNLIYPSYAFDHTLPSKPSIYEINTNSMQGDPLSPALYDNILSPFYHYENDYVVRHMYELYLQQQPQIAEVNAPNPIRTEMDEPSENIEQIIGECSGNQNEHVVKEIPKTRTSKKDRHSKIETAQGPRDRRMRLSLQVARDFFDLQDTLGYNKASKTVEWLLSKSKAAIKDLTSCSTNTPTSTSECEVVSQEKGKHLVSLAKEAKNMRGSTRKPSFNPLTKESREKARARARERTREKKKGDVSKIGFETIMSHQMNPLGSWCQDENNSSQLQVLDDVEEPSPSMIFNYHMPNTGASQEHQFTYFDLYEKPWDAYNSTNPR